MELKFTDYSINKFQSDFGTGKKTIRTKILNSGIKGLKISQSITTKKKYFVQQFWFDGNSDHWSVGEFSLGKFGIKECQTKVVQIMKTHTNDNNLSYKCIRENYISRGEKALNPLSNVGKTIFEKKSKPQPKDYELKLTFSRYWPKDLKEHNSQY